MKNASNTGSLVVPMVKSDPKSSYYTFAFNARQVFSDEAIDRGRSFINELNDQTSEAIKTVFDYTQEEKALCFTMAAYKSFRGMKNAFEKSSPGCQKLMILKVVRFLNLLRSLQEHQFILFPENPIDIMRFFLIGDWESGKDLLIHPQPSTAVSRVSRSKKSRRQQ